MYHETSTVKAIFILSSSHSGSTWIGYVLGSTAESAFLGEYLRVWDADARVPCTLCAGRGLETCEILYDLDAQPADEAFAIAAARTQKRVLIDSSKRLDWVKKFSKSSTMEFRFIHIIRDPRGWFASARRRGAANLESAIETW